MSVPVLTAVSDPRWEAELVAGLAREDHGLHVVRRCVDVVDLLAAATAGLATAVLLSADLSGLDRDTLTRLAAAGVAVVGLVPPGDGAAEQRLQQLGVRYLLPADSPAAMVSSTVRAAVATDSERPVRDYADPLSVFAGPAVATDDGSRDDRPDGEPTGNRRVIAVWGPAGAPGRSTIAANLAAECAGLGAASILVDADSYGGVIAQLLGLLDEAPGLAAACRQANNGTLDVGSLSALTHQVSPGFRVLTGITRSDRWPELRPSGIEVVLRLTRQLAEVTVVDCGFCLEQDEELAYDTAAPRRNGATLAALDSADTVVGVAGGDPVGLQRYVRGLSELAEALPGTTPVTVVNRLRRGVAGPGDPRREIAAALQRYAGVTDVHFVPADGDALDSALAAGRTLAEVAPNSPVRVAVRELAARLLGVRPPVARHRLRRTPVLRA